MLSTSTLINRILNFVWDPFPVDKDPDKSPDLADILGSLVLIQNI